MNLPAFADFWVIWQFWRQAQKRFAACWAGSRSTLTLRASSAAPGSGIRVGVRATFSPKAPLRVDAWRSEEPGSWARLRQARSLAGEDGARSGDRAVEIDGHMLADVQAGPVVQAFVESLPRDPWSLILEVLAKRVTPQSFDTWLKPTRPYGVDGLYQGTTFQSCRMQRPKIRASAPVNSAPSGAKARIPYLPCGTAEAVP